MSRQAYLYNNSYSLVNVFLYGFKKKEINGKMVEYKDSINIYPAHSYFLGEISRDEELYYKRYRRIFVELRFKEVPDKVEEVIAEKEENMVEEANPESLEKAVKEENKKEVFTKSKLMKKTLIELISIAKSFDLVVSDSSPKTYIANQILEYQQNERTGHR